MLGWTSSIKVLDWQGFKPGAFGGSADLSKIDEINKISKVLSVPHPGEIVLHCKFHMTVTNCITFAWQASFICAVNKLCKRRTRVLVSTCGHFEAVRN